jgi:hypothetical protein
MCFLRRFLIAGLLLLTGLLVGCDQQPKRMKNQPTDLQSDEVEIHLPGKKKPIRGAK